MATERRVEGKVVAVVGASGGLGEAVCDALEGRGATVVAVNRSGQGAARPIDLAIDVRDASAGAEIAATAERLHGRLDGVVVVAGIVAFGDVDQTDDIVVEELFLTNAMAPLWIARHVAPALTETSGFFVNVSGVVASSPMPGMAAYSASKAAASAAMEALAREWRRRGVLVVDAQPPHTETGLATRPLAGTAPSMPEGLQPAVAGERIVAAIEQGERVVPADQFG